MCKSYYLGIVMILGLGCFFNPKEDPKEKVEDTISKLTDFSNYNNLTKLKVRSYVTDSTDCGEWGGHKEIISIRPKYSGGEMTIYYSRERSNCYLYGMGDSLNNIIMDYDGILSPEKQEIIKDFLHTFFRYQPKGFSNASNDYEICFSDNQYFSECYKLNEPGYFFLEYEKFREGLIKGE